MPIPKKHMEILTALRVELIMDMSLKDGLLTSALRSHRLITPVMEKRYKNPYHSEPERVDELLTDLERRDENMLPILVQCLKRTGQDPLAKLIEDKARKLGVLLHGCKGDEENKPSGSDCEDVSWKGLLQKYHVHWLENLDVEHLQPYLFQEQILNHNDMEALDHCPTHQKSRIFLQILKTKSQDEFDKFIQVLHKFERADLVPDELGGNTRDIAWREMLQKYYILWLENIDVAELQPYMYQHGIFDDKDVEELEECPKLQKVSLFLRILGRKSKKKFDQYILILQSLNKDYMVPTEMKK